MDPETIARPHVGRGLSAKLLGLTLFFIMVAETLVFLPSLGRSLQVFSEQTLIELERGGLAFEVLGVGDAETRTIGNNFTAAQSEALQQELLNDTNWIGFAARLPGDRSLMTMVNQIPQTDRTIGFQMQNPLQWMGHALRLISDTGKPKVVRFTGRTRDGVSGVDVWMFDTPIRADLRSYAFRILLISLVISVFAAALVYFSLRRLIVRPIERLGRSLSHFALQPNDPKALIVPSTRRDEIGFIEGETRTMQEAIMGTLQQKERLAALGSAVAQVNHDLRGMLSTALLLSDSLESSKDPRVAKAAPILADSIERAVALCGTTLKFAKGADLAVSCQPHTLNELLKKMQAEWHARWPQAKILCRGSRAQRVQVDATALHRALDNLARNAMEAGARSLRLIWTEPHDGHVSLTVSDDGPGLPPKAEANLFVPFAGSTKADGTGLGVTNAAELLEAMGGGLQLDKTGPQGTRFRLELPAAP